MSTTTHPLPADPAYVEAARAHLDRLFPGAFFLPLSAFARLEMLTPASVRNNLSSGNLPIPVLNHRGRNFVAMPDVVEYLARIWEHNRVTAAENVAAAEPTPIEVTRPGRRVKNPALKANAAIARAALKARRAQRASEAAKSEGKQ